MVTLEEILKICKCQQLCLQDVNGCSLAKVHDEMLEKIKHLPVDCIIAHDDKIIDVRLCVNKETLNKMNYNSGYQVDKRRIYTATYYKKNREKILQKAKEKRIQKYLKEDE